eukprot:scaffold175425_cov13-Tisochrysis_lutea.AAC.1
MALNDEQGGLICAKITERISSWLSHPALASPSCTKKRVKEEYREACGEKASFREMKWAHQKQPCNKK